MSAVGNVEPSSTVEIRAQVTGALQAVGFSEGQDVKAGETLFTLDARPFEVALAQAQAALNKDTAQVQNAEAQRNRIALLVKDGISAQVELDTLVTQVATLKASVAADNAAIDSAKLQLQYTKILAPVSGRTGALLVHPGALVRANDATPLVIINQMAPVFVSFAVPSRALNTIRAEQSRAPLQVSAAPAGATEAATGTISFIDNSVDQASDTIRLKATFPNREHRLWPGQFVEVTLRLSVNPHAIVVPATAVQPSQQGSFVYVLSDDLTVEARVVTVDRTDGTDVVIANGLRKGEIVVTDGQLGLTPGAKVTVKPPAGRSEP